jgi:carboxyvinyl-carboxyphosphonate phosphorylmutase
LLVDADHGYGNALNVRRTVEELETAGVAALTIEDTILPEGFGSAGKRGFISLDEAVGKMRAAVDARSDSDMAILARTSTVAYTGLDDAVERVKAYAATGVDALFLARAETREEVDAIAEAIAIPIIFGAVNETLQDVEYLRARRVRLWPHGHLPFMAAVQAVYSTLKAIKEGMPATEIPSCATEELLGIITREADDQRWRIEYLQ